MATFSAYVTAVRGKLMTSPTITAHLTGGDVIADHIRIERYVNVSKDGPGDYDVHLDNGPMVFILPGSYSYSPMTEAHGRGDATVELDIHNRYTNDDTDWVNHLHIVDDIVIELMAGADGAGGSLSWMYALGGNIRVNASQVEQLSETELRTKVRITAMLLPGV